MAEIALEFASVVAVVEFDGAVVADGEKDESRTKTRTDVVELDLGASDKTVVEAILGFRRMLTRSLGLTGGGRSQRRWDLLKTHWVQLAVGKRNLGDSDEEVKVASQS